jgi:hypothetical protein
MDELWEFNAGLMRAVMELGTAVVHAVDDEKALNRLQPFFDELRALTEMYAKHCQKPLPEESPPDDDLRALVADLVEKAEARERDRDLPVHIKIIDTRGNDG